MEEVGILSVVESERGGSLAEDGAGAACCGEEGVGAAMMVNGCGFGLFIVWVGVGNVISCGISSYVKSSSGKWRDRLVGVPRDLAYKKSFLALYKKNSKITLYFKTTSPTYQASRISREKAQ